MTAMTGAQAAQYLREVAESWGSDPDAWTHLIETDGDARNMLRDLADNIESGDYRMP